MGLRAASVRRPNAVVMAPALTEAGQSQNFSLPPSSPITSVTPNGGYVSHDDDDVHRTACKTSAAGGAELKIKYTYRDNGAGICGADDLFHVTPTHYNNSALVRKLHTAASDRQQQKQQVLPVVHPSHNTIMNTSPTHMGDDQQQQPQQQQQPPPDTMGLQKAGMDAAMASLLKDKPTSNDVEQLLNNLTSPDDLGHNVDELMQVIKHMEGGGATSTSDSVCDVAASVPAAGDSEPTETIFPDAFDRVLFSDVDMIGMCDDETLVGPVVVAATSKEERASEYLDELHRKQLKLERRSEFLLRRLRKVQARAMGRHVSAEVAGVFELVNRTLRMGARDTTVVSETNNGVVNNELPGDTSRLTASASATVVSEPVAAIGQKTVHRLVQQLHKSAVHQASVSRPKHAARYFGSGSLDPPAAGLQRPSAAAVASGVISVPPLPAEARDEMERTAGMLQSQLTMVETQLDSDATASSSGAESCDEMQTYNNPHQNFMSIGKRAAWRYANERAAVASRWTWLQAQISDLEYRIRQHNELYRQIRACKGAVSLGEHISTSASQQQQPPQSPNAVNGYRGQLPGATKPSPSDDLVNGAVATATSPPSTGGCARIRPLNRSAFRKRKLLQTTGLHTLSKKASRPANIRCGCVPPVVPCALCTGRTDPTFPRDLPEQLTVPERIALLDPGYHPVLSFPDDISQSIHLEAIMKLPEWQQKTLRANSKSLKGLSKLDRADKIAAAMDNNRPKKSEHRNKKYNRLLKSGTVNALTNKLKNKVGRGRKPLRMNRKRHNARMAMAQMHSLASESMDEEMEALGGVATASGGGAGKSGGDSSLTPSPLSHVVPYRRSRVDSYDIDNIVIPYSVAASTRVEKLQYKEILTPKWRVIDSEFPGRYDVKNNGILRRTSEDSDVEDITDDTIAVRHDKCEHDEKKKFLSYIKFPLTVGRSRANRRTDSRAESSGANTPDPMSPHPGEISEAVSSPLTSPPATPLSMLATNEDTAQTAALRRRTVSQSRWTSEHRCNTPPDTAIELIPPYELRSFPLLEDTYEKMLKYMPDGHPMPKHCLNKQVSRDSTGTTTDLIPPTAATLADSPMFIDHLQPDSPVSSESTESAIPEEDPNDPEWMDAEKIQIRDRTKR